MYKVEIKNRDGWLYLFYYIGGKRQRESLKLKNTRENMIQAKIKRDEKLKELTAGRLKPKNKLVKKKKLTISEGLLEFETNRDDNKETTKQAYQNAVDKFIQLAGDIAIKDVTQELAKEIEKKMRRDIKKNGDFLSENTVASYINRLHIIFNFFLKEGYSEKNPFISKEINIREIVTIPDKDLDNILEKLRNKNRKHYRVIAFLLLTGLRRGEIIGLKFENNVDFSQKILKVFNYKKNRIDKLPLYGELEEFLIKEWNRYEGLLFDYKSSDSLKFFEKFLSQEGYINYSFHTLRKTFISKLINSGMNVYDVMNLARHKNIKTTLKHYSAAELSRMGDEITSRTNLKEIVNGKKKDNLRLLKIG
ncbi:MAG: site-specific integrase [Ignavibacteriaceae bacterium]